MTLILLLSACTLVSHCCLTWRKQDTCTIVMTASGSSHCCLQLVPWTQGKEDQEPDAPCVRLDIEAVNRVVFEDLKLSWDELDFIGIKKVSFHATLSCQISTWQRGRKFLGLRICTTPVPSHKSRPADVSFAPVTCNSSSESQYFKLRVKTLFLRYKYVHLTCSMITKRDRAFYSGMDLPAVGSGGDQQTLEQAGRRHATYDRVSCSRRRQAG